MEGSGRENRWFGRAAFVAVLLFFEKEASMLIDL